MAGPSRACDPARARYLRGVRVKSGDASSPPDLPALEARADVRAGRGMRSMPRARPRRGRRRCRRRAGVSAERQARYRARLVERRAAREQELLAEIARLKDRIADLERNVTPGASAPRRKRNVTPG